MNLKSPGQYQDPGSRRPAKSCLASQPANAPFLSPAVQVLLAVCRRSSSSLTEWISAKTFALRQTGGQITTKKLPGNPGTASRSSLLLTSAKLPVSRGTAWSNYLQLAVQS